jgi:hypothetical protein
MQKGEKIVCVKNIRVAYDTRTRLYVDKTYTFESYEEFWSGSKFIRVKENEHIYSYPEESFVTLKEYRKQKLERLNVRR